MTTHSGQSTMRDRIDPMVEALVKELIEGTSYPKATKDAITAALAEELMASLSPSVRTVLQASSFETAILAEALAPALAEALAPALAEALAPALVKALSELASPKKTEPEAGSKKGTDK